MAITFIRGPFPGWFGGWLGALSLSSAVLSAQLAAAPPPATTTTEDGLAPPATVIEVEGTVLAAPGDTATWRPARTNDALAVRDRLRTREQSRAALRLRDRSLFRLGEYTEFTVEAPDAPSTSTVINLWRGRLMFLHRGNPRDVQLRTRTVSAAIRGTEFHVEVSDTGRTVLTLFDGEVELANPQGALRLVAGEQAAIDPGQAPVKTPLLIPKHDLIQWCLYYPGVLDVAELKLTAPEESILRLSLAAYRSGDLLSALAQIPAGFVPVSDSTRVYQAAVLLSVGKIDAALPLLANIAAAEAGNPDPRLTARLASALLQMITLVKGVPGSPPAPLNGDGGASNCATLQLVNSYWHQGAADLEAALVTARRAVRISPEFALGWSRVAELEFGFGRRRAAQAALERSLALAPRNAQAHALRGFLLSADDRIDAALDAFAEAIAMDGSLGNAWLGRGLCRIRRGELDAGRADLQAAALFEPQRAILRSYLGKAWQEAGDPFRAGEELRLARSADPRDPTAYLYGALLLQEGNRINEAITALETSQALNDRRQLFRSRLLLDQDQAVRGANLAGIYRDAGMADWSTREAGKAVSDDYANYSAHLFLAHSYHALRDLRGVNLRYETAAQSEYLVATLLAPLEAGTLSQAISQQEYSRLFARDQVRFSAHSEYLSRGGWTHEAAGHGVIGRTGYAVEGGYLLDPGERPNQTVERHVVSVRIKQQWTPADSTFLEASRAEGCSGDLAARYDPTLFNSTLHIEQRKEPTLVAGYHREWSPSSHSLVLVSRLVNDLRVHNPQSGSLLYASTTNAIEWVRPMLFPQSYRDELELYSGEAQHLWQGSSAALILGGRLQWGELRTRNVQGLDPLDPFVFGYFDTDQPVAAAQSLRNRIERLTGYAYGSWSPLERLQLVGGIAHDSLDYPRNHRFGPIADDQVRTDAILPKAGIRWEARPEAALRLAYTRSLGGASFEQSYRLEPSQVAGFNQAYRSVLPEDLEAANAGEKMGTLDLAWEQQLPTRTYLALALQQLDSKFGRSLGAYAADDGQLAVPARLPQQLRYQEQSAQIALRQLLGDRWALGGHYRFSRAQLLERFVGLPAPTVFDGDGDPGDFPTRRRYSGDLHHARISADYFHPAGFFARAIATWTSQSSQALGTERAPAGFWHGDLWVGWRFARRRLTVTLGGLNLSARRYQLDPINVTTRPPLERTFVARLQLEL